MSTTTMDIKDRVLLITGGIPSALTIPVFFSVAIYELDACRKSETALEQVIPFELRPPEDYLDLDWSPSGLERYFQQSGQQPEVQAALTLATDGARIVNPACSDPTLPYDVVLQYPVYSHITELTPDEVQHVAATLHLSI